MSFRASDERTTGLSHLPCMCNLVCLPGAVGRGSERGARTKRMTGGSKDVHLKCTVLVGVTAGPQCDTPVHQLRVLPPCRQLQADTIFPGLQFCFWCSEHCQRNCREVIIWFYLSSYIRSANTGVHVLLPLPLVGKGAGRVH